MHDLIILGGGPAGLTAAMYAIRKRLDVLLISPDLGGKTNYHLQLPFVEHHEVISGQETVDRFASLIEYLDFVRVLERAEKVEALEKGYAVHTQAGKCCEAKALLVATGAWPRQLNVPGEWEFLGRGLSYSALSHAQLFIDRKAVVVGDGTFALRAVAELSQSAAQVYLIAPGHGELDSPIGQKIQGAANVTILEGYRVREVKGDLYVKAILIEREVESKELETDGIFVELGLVPNSQFVAHLVELDEQGRIKIDWLNRTSRPGIFAAGDVTNVYAEQVLIALGEGAKAVLSAYEYLLTV